MAPVARCMHVLSRQPYLDSLKGEFTSTSRPHDSLSCPSKCWVPSVQAVISGVSQFMLIAEKLTKQTECTENFQEWQFNVSIVESPDEKPQLAAKWNMEGEFDAFAFSHWLPVRIRELWFDLEEKQPGRLNLLNNSDHGLKQILDNRNSETSGSQKIECGYMIVWCALPNAANGSSTTSYSSVDAVELFAKLLIWEKLSAMLQTVSTDVAVYILFVTSTDLLECGIVDATSFELQTPDARNWGSSKTSKIKGGIFNPWNVPSATDYLLCDIFGLRLLEIEDISFSSEKEHTTGSTHLLCQWQENSASVDKLYAMRWNDEFVLESIDPSRLTHSFPCGIPEQKPRLKAMLRFLSRGGVLFLSTSRIRHPEYILLSLKHLNSSETSCPRTISDDLGPLDWTETIVVVQHGVNLTVTLPGSE